jgi:hypothetical protein
MIAATGEAKLMRGVEKPHQTGHPHRNSWCLVRHVAHPLKFSMIQRSCRWADDTQFWTFQTFLSQQKPLLPIYPAK